jgi:DNA modification methylase
VDEYWTNGIATLYQADARQMPIPDQSVHCAVTSPPYFGLRVYRSDSEAMIGLEETVQGYVDSMLEVMAEVGRVLRDDGMLWVNLGDSYGGSGKGPPGPKQATNKGSVNEQWLVPTTENAGQLLMIPARFALAMQDAGWILRSDVIWAKKSCMPESLNGTRWEGATLRRGSWRCTSSHEHIFQFVKSMGYYSDGEAVKTANSDVTLKRVAYGLNTDSGHAGKERVNTDLMGSRFAPASGANRRNVWSDISPEPYGGEHYATFPSDLPRLCIQASTSEAGVCAECGSQWARVVERTKSGQGHDSPKDWNPDRNDGPGLGSLHTQYFDIETKALSWRPTCTCNADKVPAVILDPFAGTGTTLLAAMRLGRRSVGVDLSPDYLGQAVKRLGKQSLPMLI